VAGKPADALTADPAEYSIIQSLRTGPASGTQRAFAEVLADVMHLEQVPADSHFFDDLGADSLVMAHFCARVRKRADLPSVSIRDVYQHPTIRDLSAALAEAAPAARPPAPRPAEVAAQASTREYILCGALQLLVFLGYAWVAALVGAWAYRWISGGSGYGDIYLRAVLFGGAAFVVLCALPIVAKWVLIGRWRPQRIRIWSLGYVRFWIVKTLVRSNPLTFLTAGSPLYAVYLRALGAKVGRGAAVFSHQVPVCADLLTIGAGAGRLDPDRDGHPRPRRFRRREDRARHQHLGRRRGAAGPRLRAAQRPGGAGR